MDLFKRLVRSINYIYILYAALVVALYYALTSSFIIDPLIGFLFAGIIPGTDVVLEPEIVLIALTDIFGLVLVASLIGWLVRRRLIAGVDINQIAEQSIKSQSAGEGRLTLAVQQAQASAAIRKATRTSVKGAQMAPAATKSMPRILKRATTRAIDVPLTRYVQSFLDGYVHVTWAATESLYRLLVFVVGMLFITVRFLLYAFVEGVVQIGLWLVAGLQLAIRGITWGTVFFIVLLGTLIDQSIRLGAYLWKAGKPYLKRFDTWLEIQFRRATGSAVKPYRRLEVLQVSSMMVKDTVRGVRKLSKQASRVVLREERINPDSDAE